MKEGGLKERRKGGGGEMFVSRFLPLLPHSWSADEPEGSRLGSRNVEKALGRKTDITKRRQEAVEGKTTEGDETCKLKLIWVYLAFLLLPRTPTKPTSSL